MADTKKSVIMKLAALPLKNIRLPGIFGGDNAKSYVENFHKINKDIHDAHSRRWYKNLAFLRGYQWLDYYNNSVELKEYREVEWRVRAVFNKLFPLWLAQTSNLINFIPNITSRPMTSEREDQLNAEFARKMLQAFWRSEHFQDIVDEWSEWKTSCGLIFILPLWDGRAGKEIEPGVFMGDIVIDIASPFEIMLDYSEQNIEKISRFLRISVKSVDYLSEKYNTKVTPEEISVDDIPSIKISRLGAGSQQIEKTLKNHTVVMEFFELPTKKFPNGLHYIGTKSKTLVEDDLNYFKIDKTGKEERILPIVVDYMYRMPGTMVGTDSVSQSVNVQTLLNKIMSSVVENADRFSRPKVYAPRGKIVRGAMSDDPREIIAEYDNEIEGEIIFGKPPEMPAYVLNFIPVIQTHIQELFGIGDISLGRIPRRATTGPVVRFLGDKDDTKLKKPRKATKKAIREIFRQVLWLMERNFKEERMVDVVGKDGVSLMQKGFMGKNLRNVDITIETDEGLPTTSAERLDLALAMLDKKLSPEQIRMAFRIIRISSMEDLENILKGVTDKEEDDARLETFLISKGMPVSPVVGEKHSLHRQIHQEAMAQPDFPDDKRQDIVQHIQQHNMLESMEAQLGIDGARQKVAGGAETLTPQEQQILGAQTPGTVPPIPTGTGGAEI